MKNSLSKFVVFVSVTLISCSTRERGATIRVPASLGLNWQDPANPQNPKDPNYRWGSSLSPSEVMKIYSADKKNLNFRKLENGEIEASYSNYLENPRLPVVVAVFSEPDRAAVDMLANPEERATGLSIYTQAQMYNTPTTQQQMFMTVMLEAADAESSKPGFGTKMLLSAVGEIPVAGGPLETAGEEMTKAAFQTNDPKLAEVLHTGVRNAFGEKLGGFMIEGAKNSGSSLTEQLPVMASNARRNTEASLLSELQKKGQASGGDEKKSANADLSSDDQKYALMATRGFQNLSGQVKGLKEKIQKQNEENDRQKKEDEKQKKEFAQRQAAIAQGEQNARIAQNSSALLGMFIAGNKNCKDCPKVGAVVTQAGALLAANLRDIPKLQGGLEGVNLLDISLMNAVGIANILFSIFNTGPTFEQQLMEQLAAIRQDLRDMEERLMKQFGDVKDQISGLQALTLSRFQNTIDLILENRAINAANFAKVNEKINIQNANQIATDKKEEEENALNLRLASQKLIPERFPQDKETVLKLLEIPTTVGTCTQMGENLPFDPDSAEDKIKAFDQPWIGLNSGSFVSQFENFNQNYYLENTLQILNIDKGKCVQIPNIEWMKRSLKIAEVYQKRLKTQKPDEDVKKKMVAVLKKIKEVREILARLGNENRFQFLFSYGSSPEAQELQAKFSGGNFSLVENYKRALNELGAVIEKEFEPYGLGPEKAIDFAGKTFPDSSENSPLFVSKAPLGSAQSTKKVVWNIFSDKEIDDKLGVQQFEWAESGNILNKSFKPDFETHKRYAIPLTPQLLATLQKVAKPQIMAHIEASEMAVASLVNNASNENKSQNKSIFTWAYASFWSSPTLKYSQQRLSRGQFDFDKNLPPENRELFFAFDQNVTGPKIEYINGKGIGALSNIHPTPGIASHVLTVSAFARPVIVFYIHSDKTKRLYPVARVEGLDKQAMMNQRFLQMALMHPSIEEAEKKVLGNSGALIFGGQDWEGASARPPNHESTFTWWDWMDPVPTKPHILHGSAPAYNQRTIQIKMRVSVWDFMSKTKFGNVIPVAQGYAPIFVPGREPPPGYRESLGRGSQDHMFSHRYLTFKEKPLQIMPLTYLPHSFRGVLVAAKTLNLEEATSLDKALVLETLTESNGVSKLPRDRVKEKKWVWIPTNGETTTEGFPLNEHSAFVNLGEINPHVRYMMDASFFEGALTIESINHSIKWEEILKDWKMRNTFAFQQYRSNQAEVSKDIADRFLCLAVPYIPMATSKTFQAKFKSRVDSTTCHNVLKYFQSDIFDARNKVRDLFVAKKFLTGTSMSILNLRAGYGRGGDLYSYLSQLPGPESFLSNASLVETFPLPSFSGKIKTDLERAYGEIFGIAQETEIKNLSD